MRNLVEAGVVFVVVGGLAGNLHGSSSVTFDLDICYWREPANLENLAAALKGLGAKLRGVSDDVVFLLDSRTLLAGENFTFATRLGALDCLGTPAGTSGFEELNANAVEMDLEDITVRVVSLNDLIRMKRAAGRPKDRIELEVLGALREELEKGT